MSYRYSLLIACCILLAPITSAHRMTEQYIPIGMSPGVSGKYSTRGVIQQMNHDARTITVRSDVGMVTYSLDDQTRIYIDRNKTKETNLMGSYADCVPGRRIEIMYRFDNEDMAQWIKVEGDN